MIACLTAWVLILALADWRSGDAAPESLGQSWDAPRFQTPPSWLSPETAARLDLGFPVLLPASVPAPFAGEPGVYASGGYYSVYWVAYGGPPTFLEVTGEVGGDIPDGSAFDLNVPLVVNATVQGLAAYHDLTPIYDTVWWQSGDVVYKVSGQGLSGTDSLSLANALVTLPPPATGGGDAGEADPGGSEPDSGGEPGGGTGSDPGIQPPGSGTTPDLGETSTPLIVLPEVVASGEVATIAVEGVSGARLEADDGEFLDTGTRVYAGVGGFSFAWEAPTVASDLTLGFVLVDAATGEWLATASTQVVASGAEGIEADPDGVGGSAGAVVDDPGAGDGTGRPTLGPVRPGTTTSNLTGRIAMTCPTVAYSGRLMPIKLLGESPAIANATLGGWPVEPGNRSFDVNVDGGPALIGDVSGDASVFIHWRAPTVINATSSRFFLTHPDGTALAECEVSVQPGEPPARRPTPTVQAPPDHDGSGGPFPFTPFVGDEATAIPAGSNGLAGDGSGGPVTVGGDGTQGPESGETTSAPDPEG